MLLKTMQVLFLSSRVHTVAQQAPPDLQTHAFKQHHHRKMSRTQTSDVLQPMGELGPFINLAYLWTNVTSRNSLLSFT